MRELLQVLALVLLLCAAVLAGVGKGSGRIWWASLLCLGLAVWLLSEMAIVGK